MKLNLISIIFVLNPFNGFTQYEKKEDTLFKCLLMDIPILINTNCIKLKNADPGTYYTLDGKVHIKIPHKDSSIFAVSAEIINPPAKQNILSTLNVKYRDKAFSYNSSKVNSFQKTTKNETIIIDTTIQDFDTLFVETINQFSANINNRFLVTKKDFTPSKLKFKIVDKIDSIETKSIQQYYSKNPQSSINLNQVPLNKRITLNENKTLLLFMETDIFQDGEYFEYRIRNKNISSWNPSLSIVTIEYNNHVNSTFIDLRVLGSRNFETLEVSMVKNSYFSSKEKFLIVILAISLLLVLVFRKIRIKNQNKKERKEALKTLKSLNGQLQPHFLSNSLNHLYILISEGDKKESLDYINLLNNYFKDILKTTDKLFIPLSEELELCEKYINIYKVKYNINLLICSELNYQLQEIDIPPLILQPFIENSVKFSDKKNSEIIDIKLNIYTKSKDLILEVENNSNQSQLIINQGSNNGIRNTGKRLAEACKFVLGSSHSIESNSINNKFSITIKLFNWI